MPMNVAQLRARRAAIAAEMRTIHDAANGGELAGDAATRWASLEGEATTIAAQEARQAQIDALDRHATGERLAGSGDNRLDDMVRSVGLLDVVRAGMGATDAAAGRARELSAELERRSGRKAQGVLFAINGGAEQRTLSTVNAPAGGTNLIGTDYRPDLLVDRLRAATKVRALGATVLDGLQGNVAIPARTASVTAGWFADDSPITASDPTFAFIGLSPKHCGAITTWSRSLVLQSSPSAETLARDDLAKVLAEALDVAAINGSGTYPVPRGILNTPGIGTVALGMNGANITYDAVADLMGQVEDANATATGFLTNSKVLRAASKLVTTTGEPLGTSVVFQGQRVEVSNLVPSNGTKGTGTGLSSLIYGNWSDLLLGIWSECDILVNQYAAGSYERGGVAIRAICSADIAVRHAASFAAITDIVA